ncbi:MAG: PleD family two-component system response regulator [Alphaproteobacteria bacterium]|nr:PleD family two-component system response regulator [Alphaproteobacteria bacterium]
MSARVLVVDDIAANVRLLEAKLLIEYYDVITANDGPTALALVAERSPDIVLLDVMMPGMDGFDVCRRIKADPATAHVPVVMVTALSEVSDRVQGLEAGADDFLTQPVNDIALFARIKSLVRLKRATDEWRARETTMLRFAEAGDDRIDVNAPGRIVLAQDENRWSGRILETLAKHGHELIHVSSSTAALAEARKSDPHLVLVDDRVGGEDALRLCSQIRSNEETRHIPILLMIDQGNDRTLVTALELGVNDYLPKPVDRDELVARSRTQVRRKRFEDGLRAKFQQSVAAAVTDSLTGLYNRRYLDAHFEAMSSRLAQAGKMLSLVALDIDHFKVINDTHGHAAGDEVLKTLAERILANLRGLDSAVRHGGEEFVILMPDSPLASASAAAERLRVAVAAEPIKIGAPAGAVSVTVSIGVASATAGMVSLEDLISRADAALYEAKRSGRNCVMRGIENEPDEAPRPIAATR